MAHGCEDCKVPILEASRRTYAATGNVAAAYKAAVAVFRQRHPEKSDPQVIARTVAVIIRRATIESRGTFWSPGDESSFRS